MTDVLLVLLAALLVPQFYRTLRLEIEAMTHEGRATRWEHVAKDAIEFKSHAEQLIANSFEMASSWRQAAEESLAAQEQLRREIERARLAAEKCCAQTAGARSAI